MGDTRSRAYHQGAGAPYIDIEDFPLEAVSDELAVPGTFVWVDFVNPDVEELYQLAEELGLHELAVEDALGPHQRPKLDPYDTHFFLSTHALSLDAASGELRETEIDAFIHERWLVTVRKDDGFAMDAVVAGWNRSPNLAVNGVSFLLYGILDVIVDGYFETVSIFDEYYDEVSEAIFAERPLSPEQQRRWFRMRQSLVHFHRLVVPMREAVSALMRRDHSIVNEPMYPYFQDVYDHVLRVSESTEALRDLMSTIVEANLTVRDFRQNQIVKQVTSWAAIIAVPTLITGYYGMNVPYPGSGEPWGVAVSGALIVGLSGALYLLFRKRDWL